MRSVILLLCLCSPALSKIGESKEKCLERYGELVEDRNDGIRIQYRKGGIKTTCWFENDRCCGVTYLIDKFSMVVFPQPLSGPSFTIEQQNQLLELNSEGGKWIPKTKGDDPNAKYENMIQTEDGRLHARVNIGVVCIEDVTVYRRLLNEVSKESIGNAVESFLIK